MGDIHGVGGPARRLLMPRAATTAVLLSVLFVAVYGGTNWFTAQRPDGEVKAWYFPRELQLIPFVPWLVVPYMSIDLFFSLAPFLCRDQRELRAFRQRVVFTIAVAAVFFLLMPLKLQWPERPRVGGWFGSFVEQSLTAPYVLEYPHNLFPAMHIALCLILADIYGRHTRGVVRALLFGWFALIALATVFTWQHHIVDVAGGAVLGAFAFYLVRESPLKLPLVRNGRIGGYYAVGAASLLALAPVAWPWGAFLLWPAAGLGMVAAGYFALGPGVYRKTDGLLPLSSRFVLAPVLIGQYLSLAYYRRRCRAWDPVAPGVLIGRTLSEAEAAAAVNQGVTAALDLTAEFSEAAAFRKIRYHQLPILDLTAPTQGQLQAAAAVIAREAARGTVYVHCKIGYSRSAAVVGAYLLASHELATAEEAIDRLRKARPSIVVRPEAVAALRAFARTATAPMSPAAAAL